MPTVQVDIENTDLTVTRPVVMRLAYDLVSAMGLPNNTKVILPGSSDEQDIPIAVLDRGSNPIYGNELKVLLEVNETLVEERSRIADMSIHDNKPIFHDSDYDITLAPTYTHHELDITLKFRFPNKQAAEKQMSDMKRHAVLFRDRVLHEVEYTYIIPRVCLVILAELHRCKEVNLPTGQSLTEYVASKLDSSVTTASNLTGTALELVKKELQTRIQGFFDFDIIPDRGDDDEIRNAHILTFNYKVRYDKILSIIMKYPYILNNTHISEKYFDATIPYQLGRRLQAPPRLTAYLDTYTTNNDITGYIDGAPIPHYHDWYPRDKLVDMVGLLRVLLEVDNDYPRELFNLTELGIFKIHPKLIEYMKSDYSNLTKHKQSVVNVSLYEDGNLRNGDVLTIDEDLNIRTTFDFDLSVTYTVWVSVLADFNLLSKSAFKKLVADGEFCLFILNAIDPSLNKRGLLPKLESNGSVNMVGLRSAMAAIVKRRNPTAKSTTYGNYRVGSFIIAVS